MTRRKRLCQLEPTVQDVINISPQVVPACLIVFVHHFHDLGSC